MEDKIFELTFFVQFFEHKLICHPKMTNSEITNCIILILNGIRKQYAEGKLKLSTVKEEQVSVDQIAENRIPYIFIELPGRVDIETEKKIEEKKIRSFYIINESGNLLIQKIKQIKQNDGKIDQKELAKQEIKKEQINLLNLSFASEFDQLKNKNQFINIYSAGFSKVSSIKDQKYYTKEEVSKHNSTEDAWMIINGQVYDITEYAKVHPGGKSILIKRAGQDGTEFLSNIHIYIRIILVKFHPYVNASRLLEKYYLGAIKK